MRPEFAIVYSEFTDQHTNNLANQVIHGNKPMSELLFDVSGIWRCDQGGHPPRPDDVCSANGLANGIEFSLFGPNWLEGTTMDGSFTGFSDPVNHRLPLAFSDRVHIADKGRFWFSSEISRIDVYLAKNRLQLHDFPIEFRTEEAGAV